MTTTVNSAFTTRPSLPPLPLEEWEQTKETLHLWVQIVGKIRMATSPPRNHWWHVPLYVDVRGLTTRRLHAADGTSFQIDFDFIDHRILVRTSRGEVESFALVDDLSVAAFDERLHATLRDLGVDVAIRETPYGIPTTTPFPQDVDHAVYDRRRSRALLADPRLDRRRVRDLLRVVLRQDEPCASLLALPRPRGDALRRRALAGRTRLAAQSTGRRTRTTSSRSASGRATGTSASRRTTPTPLRSLKVSANRRSAQTRPSGSNEPADRSRSCPTRQSEPLPIRGERCSRSSRAPTRRVRLSAGGIGASSHRRGALHPANSTTSWAADRGRARRQRNGR